MFEKIVNLNYSVCRSMYHCMGLYVCISISVDISFYFFIYVFVSITGRVFCCFCYVCMFVCVVISHYLCHFFIFMFNILCVNMCVHLDFYVFLCKFVFVDGLVILLVCTCFYSISICIFCSLLLCFSNFC